MLFAIECEPIIICWLNPWINSLTWKINRKKRRKKLTEISEIAFFERGKKSFRLTIHYNNNFVLIYENNDSMEIKKKVSHINVYYEDELWHFINNKKKLEESWWHCYYYYYYSKIHEYKIDDGNGKEKNDYYLFEFILNGI